MLVQYGMLRPSATERRDGATTHMYEMAERPRIENSAWGRMSAVERRATVQSVLVPTENSAWGRMSAVERRATVQSVLVPTGEMVERALRRDGFDHEASAIVRVWLEVDEEGYEQASAVVARMIEALQLIEQRAAPRLAAGATRMRAASVVLLFEDPDA